MLLAGLVDFGERGIEGLPGAVQLGLQRLERPLLGVQPALQLLAALHHIQQGVFQAGLTAKQRLQLVLEVRELLGVRRTRLEQRSVAVFALPHRLDLRLESRYLNV